MLLFLLLQNQSFVNIKRWKFDIIKFYAGKLQPHEYSILECLHISCLGAVQCTLYKAPLRKKLGPFRVWVWFKNILCSIFSFAFLIFSFQCSQAICQSNFGNRILGLDRVQGGVAFMAGQLFHISELSILKTIFVSHFLDAIASPST